MRWRVESAPRKSAKTTLSSQIVFSIDGLVMVRANPPGFGTDPCPYPDPPPSPPPVRTPIPPIPIPILEMLKLVIAGLLAAGAVEAIAAAMERAMLQTQGPTAAGGTPVAAAYVVAAAATAAVVAGIAVATGDLVAGFVKALNDVSSNPGIGAQWSLGPTEIAVAIVQGVNWANAQLSPSSQIPIPTAASLAAALAQAAPYSASDIAVAVIGALPGTTLAEMAAAIAAAAPAFQSVTAVVTALQAAWTASGQSIGATELTSALTSVSAVTFSVVDAAAALQAYGFTAPQAFAGLETCASGYATPPSGQLYESDILAAILSVFAAVPGGVIPSAAGR